MTRKTRESLVQEIRAAEAEVNRLVAVRASVLRTNPNADVRVFDTQLIPQARARQAALVNELRSLAENTPSTRPPRTTTRRNTRPSTPQNQPAASTTTPDSTTKPDAATQPVGISPYIASIESFDPRIQYELLRRTRSSEMADVYMPFVKLTSLSNVLGDNLAVGETCKTGSAWFPSLGIHGQREVSFDDMYTPTVGNRSIIGYATANTAITVPPIDGTGESSITLPGKIPVLVTEADAANDPTNIPMPGIVKMSTERTTAGSMGVRGGLFKATLDIKAYSTGQVNALLRYFLRPATRVILELGHQRTNAKEGSSTFNWVRPTDSIIKELKPLVTLNTGQREFIDEYIYENFGNYEIFIGYVVDFKLKFTKENVYDIQLIIHSLQQFEVPTKSTGVQSVNGGSSIPDKCRAIEITDYFDPPSGWRINSFTQLMATATSPTPSPELNKPLVGTNWNEHVIPLQGAGSAPGAGGNSSPGYLVSWEFFVNVILNNSKAGLLSVFGLANDSPTLKLLEASVIRKIEASPELVDGKLSVNSGEVSWDPDLRSTNPDVMVIYNKNAAGGPDISSESGEQIARKMEQFGVVNTEEAVDDIINGFGQGSIVKNKIKSSPIGSFDEVPPTGGTSYLTKGVWLNTNAIIDAFTGADTVATAINKLLTDMNNATSGFWNLQLLSNDTENPGLHVIDMGLSKAPKNQQPTSLTNTEIFSNNILNSVDDENSVTADLLKLGTKVGDRWKPTYIYTFNRGLQTQGDYDTGGELLDISLESDLPQVIAVQAIAGVGGQMQRGALEAIDINELRRITLYPEVYPGCSPTSNAPCREIETEPPKPPSEMPSAVANRIKNLVENGAPAITQSVTELLKKEVDDYVGQCPDLPETPSREDRTARRECEKRNDEQQAEANQYVAELQAAARETYESERPGYLELVSQYGARFGSVLDLIEYDTTRLQQRFDKNSKQQEVHPFNSSNLTKTTVDLTLPGIGGIQLFQSFNVARAPNILNRGYYVVTRVNHEFGESGWTTKIQGRFRYNPKVEDTGTQQSGGCPPVNGTCSDTPPSPTQ